MALRALETRPRSALRRRHSRTTAWKPRCARPPTNWASRPARCSNPSAWRCAAARTRRRCLTRWKCWAARSLLERIDRAIGKIEIAMNPSNPDTPRRIKSPAGGPSNFIRDIILEDLHTNKYDGRVHTRFPPEPNGYLHIGHAKSICLNFGLAAEFGGKTNLRFDDTNPSKEETEYVDSIMDDVRWLGFEWEDRVFYASDYFGQLYEWAVQLIQAGKAYVCDLTRRGSAQVARHAHRAGQGEPLSQPLRRRESRSVRAHEGRRVSRWLAHPARQNRHGVAQPQHARPGDVPHPARRASPHRQRVVHLPDVRLRARPIRFHRSASRTPSARWNSKTTARSTTGTVEQLGIYHPQQIEFDRLNLTYTLLSKRKLLQLVQNGLVRGWDDPRMPTISGMRRRGYTPEALRNFCGAIGVSKTNGITELGLLEYYVREDLNKRALRVMAVLRPLRVVIDNYPEGQVEQMEAVNNPEDASAGTRTGPVFARALHRAGRFPRRSAQAVFPPVARPRSAPALRLLHHLHRRGEERRGRSDRSPLHLRSGHARRQRARWTQSEIDHPLGFGRACHRRRSAPLRNSLHRARIPTKPKRARTSPPI